MLNPNYYLNDYDDNASFSDSDIRRGLNADLQLMNAQRDLDEEWYQAHESRKSQFDELVALGMNPMHAMRAVAGETSGAASNTAATVGQSGGNGALQSVMDAFGTGSNAFNNAIQTDIAASTAKATVQNLNSDTALKNIDAMSRAGFNSATIRNLETSADVNEAKVGELSASAEEKLAAAHLSEAEEASVRQQMSRFNEVTDAQITLWQNQAHLFFEEAKNQVHVRENLDALTEVYGSQNELNLATAANERAKVMETVANTRNIEAKTQNIQTQTAGLMTINNFQAQYNIPFNADITEKVNAYLSKGEFDKAENYLNLIFDVAATNKSGELSGRIDFGTSVLDAPHSRGRFGEHRRRSRVYYNP